MIFFHLAFCSATTNDFYHLKFLHFCSWSSSPSFGLRNPMNVYAKIEICNNPFGCESRFTWIMMISYAFFPQIYQRYWFGMHTTSLSWISDNALHIVHWLRIFSLIRDFWSNPFVRRARTVNEGNAHRALFHSRSPYRLTLIAFRTFILLCPSAKRHLFVDDVLLNARNREFLRYLSHICLLPIDFLSHKNTTFGISRSFWSRFTLR